MNYRKFGRTGLKVSPLALGTFNFGMATAPDEADRIMAAAVEAGINLFDTANYYNGGDSERIVGRYLKDSGQRNKVVLATKAYFPVGDGPNDRGSSRQHIMQACEASLRRLQTDHIDLYQLHRPDPNTPIDETLGALTDLLRQGKVRYIGTSTFPAWGLMEAIMTSELRDFVRPVSEQPPYNLLDRRIENELVPLCQKYEIALLPWGAFALGILTGRYADVANLPADSRAKRLGGVYAERVTARGIALGTQFVALAQEIGILPAQLAMLWVKDQPGVTAPLIGPKSVAQLADFVPVMEMALTDAMRVACDRLVPPGSAAVNFHNSAEWMKMTIS